MKIPDHRNFVSQLGQDHWVAEVAFAGRRSGYFVDVGAFDGVTISNTLALERDYGWTGVCIEPSNAFERLAVNRACICERAVIDATPREVEFNESSWNSGVPAWYSKPYRPRSVSTRQTTTLTDVLDRHNAPGHVEYLSIDTEGMELNVLQGLDFQRYTFGVITVEHNLVETARQAVRAFLEAKSYVALLEVGIETWFCSTSIAESLRPDWREFASVFYQGWGAAWSLSQEVARLEKELAAARRTRVSAVGDRLVAAFRRRWRRLTRAAGA